MRGVNVGGHHKVSMDALRALYESLGFQGVQTYINSGNVLFTTAARDPERLRQRIEDAFESACGFHSHVILRAPADLRSVVARNPFAARPAIDAGRVAVHFLTGELSAALTQQILAIHPGPEELHAAGRELYIYYTNGMARPQLSLPRLEKTMRMSGTSRNWNTVRKLLALAEKLESAPNRSKSH